MFGTYRITMLWDGGDVYSDYVVNVVGVESQSLVGYYTIYNPFRQDSKLTEITGHFPIRCIQKMEKIA